MLTIIKIIAKKSNRYLEHVIPNKTGNVLIPDFLSPSISAISFIISLINVNKNVSNAGYNNLVKKSESYEICFVPDNDYRNFLKNRVEAWFLLGTIALISINSGVFLMISANIKN